MNIFDSVTEHPWIKNQSVWVWILLSTALFVFTIVLAMFILTRLPASYFMGARRPKELEGWPPALRFVLRLLKNLFGVVLVLLGLVLMLPGIPGQGLLLIILGVVLTSFPGKRRLERKLVQHKTVRKALNRMRERAGKEPFKFETG